MLRGDPTVVRVDPHGTGDLFDAIGGVLNTSIATIWGGAKEKRATEATKYAAQKQKQAAQAEAKGAIAQAKAGVDIANIQAGASLKKMAMIKQVAIVGIAVVAAAGLSYLAIKLYRKHRKK